MTTVVVAEKPSVARDIARVIGASKKGEGCLHGDGYAVTWALGHLVQFAEPDEYGPPWNKRWSFAQLPMIPQQWRLRPVKEAAAQLRVVKKLLNDPDTHQVVCATDAGREGENIFRLIYEHIHCRKPVRRLWVSSLTDAAIRAGFQQLKDGAQFDRLAAAARARAQADWLVGMNLTRAYTVHNKVLCTIGRVQTPALAMLVERDKQISSFRKTYYYELVARLAEGFPARYSRDGETRIDKKEEAEWLHRELSSHTTGTVQKTQNRERRNHPPPLYDLNSLQRDANSRFGFTAAQTLKHAQALYERHKLISYPRTESRHISEDMVPQLPGILEKLDHPQAGAALKRLRKGYRLSKAYVDRTRLTDHHAIVPTGQKPPARQSPELRRIYELVVSRFVSVFLPDEVVQETEVELDIGGATFVARGNVVVQPGWKVVDQRPERAAHPGAAPGRPVESQRQDGPGSQQAHEQRPDERALQADLATVPPQADGAAGGHARGTGADRGGSQGAGGTDRTGPQGAAGADSDTENREVARALAALKHGQVVHVERMDVVEKETRPPRPYTDATLLLAMKNAGRQIEDDTLAAAMKQSGLGTPATRAEIIEKLIRSGYVRRERRQLRSTDKAKALIGLVAEPLRSPELTAEWEQQLQDVEEGKLAADEYYERIAAFVRSLVPQVAAGQALSAEQVSAAREQQSGRRGRKGRGKPKGTQSVLQATDLGKCPVCRQGDIVETARAYGCSRYRQGCGFTIWKSMAGRKLPRKIVEQLIQAGRAEPVDGFVARSGKRFTARLRLDETGKVEFDFGSNGRQSGNRDRRAGPAGGAKGALDSGEAAAFLSGRRPSGGDATAPARPGGAAKAGTVETALVPRSSRPGERRPPGATSTSSPWPRCPRCGQDTIVEGKRGYGCSRYREGCHFVVWKEIAGKKLTEKQVRTLIEKGRTRVIRGFKSADGQKYAARLRLDSHSTVIVEPVDDA